MYGVISSIIFVWWGHVALLSVEYVKYAIVAQA